MSDSAHFSSHDFPCGPATHCVVQPLRMVLGTRAGARAMGGSVARRPGEFLCNLVDSLLNGGPRSPKEGTWLPTSRRPLRRSARSSSPHPQPPARPPRREPRRQPPPPPQAPAPGAGPDEAEDDYVRRTWETFVADSNLANQDRDTGSHLQTAL